MREGGSESVGIAAVGAGAIKAYSQVVRGRSLPHHHHHHHHNGLAMAPLNRSSAAPEADDVFLVSETLILMHLCFVFCRSSSHPPTAH